MLNWIKENIKTIIIIGTLTVALAGGFILFQYKNMQLQEAVLLKMYSFVEEEAKKLTDLQLRLYCAIKFKDKDVSIYRPG